MAKSYGPIVDAYKKKSRDRKRRGGDLFYNAGSLLKALPSGRSKKRKKHSYSSKKTYASSTTKKNTTKKATTQTQATEPLTGSDIRTLFVFFAIIIGFCILWSKVGFLLAVLISLVLMTIVLIITVTIESKQAERAAEMNQYLNAEPEETDRSTQIPYLKSLLGEIRKHQTIVNTSNNPDEVKKHLDCLLGIMDEIATFDEAVLKQAGMTKAHYESSRAELLELYDVMIAQARENNAADSTTEQPEAEEQQSQASSVANEGVVPLESYLKVAVPSNQGLYPHEILMLHYANTYKVDGVHWQPEPDHIHTGTLLDKLEFS